MKKYTYLNLMLILIFVLIIYDFYSLSSYKEKLINYKEITNKCLYENKDPNDYLPDNVSYTCSLNCDYNYGEIVEYKISIKAQFFFDLLNKEYSNTYYYYISDVKFYE